MCTDAARDGAGYARANTHRGSRWSVEHDQTKVKHRVEGLRSNADGARPPRRESSHNATQAGKLGPGAVPPGRLDENPDRGARVAAIRVDSVPTGRQDDEQGDQGAHRQRNRRPHCERNFEWNELLGSSVIWIQFAATLLQES
jgi:hypothetical protein